MAGPFDVCTSLRPQAGLASDRLGLTLYLAVVFSYKDNTLKVRFNNTVVLGKSDVSKRTKVKQNKRGRRRRFVRFPCTVEKRISLHTAS